MSAPRRAVPAGLLLAVLVSGCAQIGQPPGEGPVVHPGGSAVVVRVDTSGGLVPYEALFTNLPDFTLLGDGRIIVEGPVSDVFPGPAMPNVLVRRVTEEGIQSVIFRLLETGLFEENQSFTGAGNVVADAPTTTFTLRADDREVVVDVYALGTLIDMDPLPPGVTEAEVEANRSLFAIESAIHDLESWISADDWADPEWQPYVPTAFRLLATDITNEPPNPDDTTPEPIPWPGTTPPDQFEEVAEGQGTRCGVVMGNEAAAWHDALSQADQLARWAHGDALYRVTPRPLLPDEVLDCGPIER
jgi:hypothetical protein